MIPETRRYRLKNKLLGPPLVTEQLSSERLGRPTALAILSSDVISSSAYATEQALIPLIKVIGVAAFSLLMPVSVAVIVVLAFVTEEEGRRGDPPARGGIPEGRLERRLQLVLRAFPAAPHVRLPDLDEMRSELKEILAD